MPLQPFKQMSMPMKKPVIMLMLKFRLMSMPMKKPVIMLMQHYKPI
jgi:hypothetical protein